MQELIHDQPIEPSTPRMRPKKILFVLLLLGLLAGGGYFFWQEMYQKQSPSPLQSTILKDGTVMAPDTTEKFSNPKNGTAVAVGSCTAGQQVALSTTGTIAFSGLITQIDEPYCEMVLTANGRYGPGTFDCVYKLDDRAEIYLHVDESGADQDFIRQHCTIRN